MKSIITYILLFITTIAMAQEIPLTLYKGVPIIKLTINDVEGRFLVDTGASKSILFIKAKRKMKFNVLTAIEGSQFTGIGGGTAMYRVNHAVAVYKGELFLNFRVGAGMTSVADRLQIVGIVGSDILSTGWIIDYSNSILTK